MPTTVFLADTITAAERQAVKARILAIPGARDVKYESREQAWRRFHELFKHDPGLVRSVPPAALPESFQFVLADPAAVSPVIKSLGSLPGVYRVTTPERDSLMHGSRR